MVDSFGLIKELKATSESTRKRAVISWKHRYAEHSPILLYYQVMNGRTIVTLLAYPARSTMVCVVVQLGGRFAPNPQVPKALTGRPFDPQIFMSDGE